MKANIKHWQNNPLFSVLERDVTAPIDVEIDSIYNLASPASPADYQSDPVRTVTTNVLGAANLLELAHHRRARVLQASTSEVYGDPNVHPQTEGYWGHVNPIGPRSCYDEGKRCAETLFFDYWRQHSVRIKVARIFNTYGPRMRPDDGRVVSNFISQALQGSDLTIYGTGEQTRSFCYVDDLIDGLVRLMNSADAIVGPVNLGNPHEFTILELANRVLQITGSRSRLSFLPLPKDDPRQRQPDIQAAHRLLAWAPSIDLEEGLVRTISHFRELPALVPPERSPHASGRWRQAAQVEQDVAPRSRGSSLPSISIIMPLLNEARHIVQTLTQLAEQDYPTELVELIVADGGSTDATRRLIGEAAGSFPFRLKLLDNPRRLAGAGRNLAIRHASGDYILVIDGHVFIPSPFLLRDMATAAIKHHAVVLGRPQPMTPPGLTSFQAVVAAVRASPLAHSVESHIYGQKDGWVSPISVGVMYRRGLFEQFGYFDEDLDAVEDLEFNYRLERAGLSAYISPRFTVFYYPRESLGKLLRHMYRYGLGRINFGRKHPERIRPEVYAPLGACLVVATCLGVFAVVPTLRLALASIAAVLFVAVMILTSGHLQQGKVRWLWMAPVCLLTVHVGLAYGVVRGLLGRRSGVVAPPPDPLPSAPQ
jgi:UDP-glucuronate decarboxylase